MSIQVIEKWSIVYDVSVAGAALVFGMDHQTSSTIRSAATLQPQIASQNNLFKRWLRTQYH